jgi:hypothetical protein
MSDIIKIKEIPGILPAGFEDEIALDIRIWQLPADKTILIKTPPFKTVDDNTHSIPRLIQSQKYQIFAGEIVTSESIDIALIPVSNITTISPEVGSDYNIFDFVITGTTQIQGSIKYNTTFEFKSKSVDNESVIDYLESDYILAEKTAGRISDIHTLSLKNSDTIDAQWTALSKTFSIYTALDYDLIYQEEKQTIIESKGMKYIAQVQKFTTYQLTFFLDDSDFAVFMKYANIGGLKEGIRNYDDLELDLESGTATFDAITILKVEENQRPELINLHEIKVDVQVTELIYTPLNSANSANRTRYHQINIKNAQKALDSWWNTSLNYSFYTSIEPDIQVVEGEGENYTNQDGIVISSLERRYIVYKITLILDEDTNVSTSGLSQPDFLMFYGPSCFYELVPGTPLGFYFETDVGGTPTTYQAIERPQITVIENENLVKHKQIEILMKVQELEYSRSN